MTGLLGIGSSGMISQSEGMNTIGNNIANTQTVGYKSGTTLYTDQWQPPGGVSANGIRVQQGRGVDTAGTMYDWGSGILDSTGVMSHIAISGDGFLPVESGGETVYTRAGDFSFAETQPGSGQFVLMRPNGAIMLDANLDAITFDAIPDSLEIAPDGTITVVGATTGSTQVGVQTFGNPDTLIHEGNGLYRVATSTILSNTITADLPGTGQTGFLRQGELEHSNVDLIKEFTGMISTQRAFQANSRTVRTADEMLQEILGLKR
jgi:flagellar hook protein FlgE